MGALSKGPIQKPIGSIWVDRVPRAVRALGRGLVESGTHSIFGVNVGPYEQGEITLAKTCRLD
jgi:hypothetical protein